MEKKIETIMKTIFPYWIFSATANDMQRKTYWCLRESGGVNPYNIPE